MTHTDMFISVGYQKAWDTCTFNGSYMHLSPLSDTIHVCNWYLLSPRDVPGSTVGPGCPALNKTNEVQAVLELAGHLWGRHTVKHTRSSCQEAMCTQNETLQNMRLR